MCPVEDVKEGTKHHFSLSPGFRKGKRKSLKEEGDGLLPPIRARQSEDSEVWSPEKDQRLPSLSAAHPTLVPGTATLRTRT